MTLLVSRIKCCIESSQQCCKRLFFQKAWLPSICEPQKMNPSQISLESLNSVSYGYFISTAWMIIVFSLSCLPPGIMMKCGSILLTKTTEQIRCSNSKAAIFLSGCIEVLLPPNDFSFQLFFLKKEKKYIWPQTKDTLGYI